MKRPRAVKLRYLPEMPKVVRSPLAQHLMERNVTKVGVSRFSLTGVRRDAP